MIDDSLLEQTLRRLNLKWVQADRKYRWMLTEEKGVLYIKRNVKIMSSGKKTFQRLPRKLYNKLSKQDLQDLVTRLNYNEDREKRMRERFKINSAFIPNSFLKEFYELLESEIPTLEVVQGNWAHLERHFLRYFIQFGANPMEWHRDHQAQWCNYLFETGLGPRSLRSIVQISNRFVKFLHWKRPNEIPLMIFKPISKARFRKFSVEWDESDRGRKRSYISELNYAQMVKKIPNEIKSVFILCYKFGLRRGESMGLYERPECVKKGYLHINKQLKQYTRDHELKLDTTKGRAARKVPYWYSSPEEVYNLIQKMVVLCPDEYSRKFSEFCKSIELDFTVHDCRHTFITNAVNEKDVRLNEVRLAVGHTDLRVTSGYLRDNTEYDDEVWIPEQKKAS